MLEQRILPAGPCAAPDEERSQELPEGLQLANRGTFPIFSIMAARAMIEEEVEAEAEGEEGAEGAEAAAPAEGASEAEGE